MYVKDSTGGETLNMGDTWFDAKNNVKLDLTDAQRNYRDFAVRAMNEGWIESMSAQMEQNMGTFYSSTISKAEFYGLPAELPMGFFPRAPLSELDEDIKFSDNPLSNFAQSAIDEARRSIRNNLSDYEDPDFQDHGRDSALISVKFFSHPGDGKAADRRKDGHRVYTHDFGAAFKMFMRNQIRKKHMDDAFIIGMAAHNILRFKKSSKSSPELRNLAEFLEKQVLMHTIDEYDKDSFLHRPVVYKLNWIGSKVWGLDEGTTVSLSAYKMMRLLMRHSSFITMSFKPMLFAFNFSMIQAQNFSKAVSGSILKSLGNVPPEHNVPTISSYLATMKDYGTYVKDGLSGNLAKNKAWILARKWSWLADATEHGRSFDSVLDYRNLLGLNSLGYMFSRVSETEGSIYHLISLLKAYKWKFDDNTTVSFWDLYDENGEYKVEKYGSRGKVDTGYGTTTELYGLDEREVKNLKRVNETLQGSYRKEERIALEYTLMGNMLLQFRRYLPTMLKNNLRSPYSDSTQGTYTKKAGEDTYEWQARMAYGRWRIILNYLHMDPRKSRQRWKTDPVAFREELVHAFTALGLSLGTNAALEDIFPQDSALDKRIGYLTQSLSQGMSPNDVLTDVTRSPIAALTSLSNFSKYGWELLWDGIIHGKETQDGHLRGEKGFIRTLPFLGSWQQMQRYMDDAFHASNDRR